MLFVSGSQVTRVRIPASGEILIGRDRGCDVCLDDVSVSRKHMRIRGGAPPMAEDLGSTNGTRVSGTALAVGDRVGLRVGSVLELGAFVAYIQLTEEGDAERVHLMAGSEAEEASAAAARIDIVIENAGMRDAYALIDVVKDSKMSILVLGETGVGKDVYAEALHRASHRNGKPYLRLNCAALTESLLEAELFGYEKGAFTGATAAKPGLFESADGGTVFLDEIGEMPLVTQAKLLRVLENGEVMRIGALKPKRIDVRFVSATHRDLEALVSVHKFREDLYYRLNGVCVTIPPLRDRREEIPALVAFFLSRSENGPKKPARISDAARAMLVGYRWPGNVRELRNVVERAELLARGGEIDVAHIQLRKSAETAPSQGSVSVISSTAPAHESTPQRVSQSMKGELAEIEKDRILEALEECGGNQSRAAKALGISRTTLIKRMDDYGVTRPRKG